MSEIDWIATTKSGAKYTRKGSSIVYEGRHGRVHFRNASMSILDRDVAMSSEDQWAYIRSVPPSDVPELGKSIYVFGFSEWRISSDIVQIEFPGIDNTEEV